LWERFENNPNEVQLAARLKIIDDLIAECSEQGITANRSSLVPDK